MRSYILDGKQLMDVSDRGVTEYAAAVYSSATAVKPELIDEEEERDQTKPPSSSLIEHHERLPSRPGLIRPIASRGDTEPPTLLCLLSPLRPLLVIDKAGHLRELSRHCDSVFKNCYSIPPCSFGQANSVRHFTVVLSQSLTKLSRTQLC